MQQILRVGRVFTFKLGCGKVWEGQSYSVRLVEPSTSYWSGDVYMSCYVSVWMVVFMWLSGFDIILP